MKTIRYLIFGFSLLLLMSCNRSNENGESINSDKYIDKPFSQLYHDGFIVNANSADANDVRAIQPDNIGDIWIATKGGIFRKKQDS